MRRSPQSPPSAEGLFYPAALPLSSQTLNYATAVIRQLRGSRAPRYWLLETLRQYGRQRLRELGQEAVIWERHFAWMCALGKTAGAWDSRQADVFQRLHQERDNLWAALGFCLRRPDVMEPGAELARNLLAYWLSRGPLADVRRVLAALIEAAPANSIPRARLLWVAASMALSQNDYDASAALSEESLRIGTETRWRPTSPTS
jgi:hypothetical protein